LNVGKLIMMIKTQMESNNPKVSLSFSLHGLRFISFVNNKQF